VLGKEGERLIAVSAFEDFCEGGRTDTPQQRPHLGAVIHDEQFSARVASLEILHEGESATLGKPPTILAPRYFRLPTIRYFRLFLHFVVHFVPHFVSHFVSNQRRTKERRRQSSRQSSRQSGERGHFPFGRLDPILLRHPPKHPTCSRTKNFMFMLRRFGFSTTSSAWTSVWDRKHAVVDELIRATESMVLNLAVAAQMRDTPGRLRTLDYSLGSTLESSACLDIALIKQFLTHEQCQENKLLLCEITRMLVGLRKAWAESILREEPPDKGFDPQNSRSVPLFHHENLKVYLTALGFIQWFTRQIEARELTSRLFRRIDEVGTSVVLNVAEGNGRYSELDHLHFLNLAQTAAVKGAVYLDLAVARRVLDKSVIGTGKEILREIGAMIGGLICL
jgi:four helix bundle protein